MNRFYPVPDATPGMSNEKIPDEPHPKETLDIDIMQIYRMSCSKCKKKLEKLLAERRRADVPC